MKRYIWPVLFFTLFTSLISCTEETCNLNILTRTGQGSPTFTYYGCVIESEVMRLEGGSQDGTFSFIDITPGLMEITVDAIDESEGMHYQGKSIIEARLGVNEIVIDLEKRDKESKNIILRFSEFSESIATLKIEENGRILFQGKKVSEGMFELLALPYGNYVLTLSRNLNGNIVRMDYHFTCNTNTPEELIFLGEDDKNDGIISMDFFDLHSSPIQGKIKIHEGNESISLEIEVLKTTTGVRENEIDFMWFENGIYLCSGKKLEIDKKNGVHRYDCLLKSRFLGSYGSETISICISE